MEGLFQPMHLLVLLGVLLLVLGPKRLPELGRGLGDGIKGFKESIRAKEDEPTPASGAAEKEK